MCILPSSHRLRPPPPRSVWIRMQVPLPWVFLPLVARIPPLRPPPYPRHPPSNFPRMVATLSRPWVPRRPMDQRSEKRTVGIC